LSSASAMRGVCLMAPNERCAQLCRWLI
jgi:hypothetical protein